MREGREREGETWGVGWSSMGWLVLQKPVYGCMISAPGMLPLFYIFVCVFSLTMHVCSCVCVAYFPSFPAAARTGGLGVTILEDEFVDFWFPRMPAKPIVPAGAAAFGSNLMRMEEGSSNHGHTHGHINARPCES